MCLIISFTKHRCDSFGNRPVTATSQYRKSNGPGGRTRSGSTGNRPQTVNTNNRQNQNSQQTQQNSHQVRTT